MSQFLKEPQLEHPVKTTTGVLLVNLGTPDALDYFSLRRYLDEFLMDPRVVEMPRLLWATILRGVLLNFIPFRSAKAYTKIWDHEKNDSPLRLITKSQAEKLQPEMGSDIMVDYAMRYGNPSIPDAINRMKEKGVNKLVVLPLYPQYSAVTSASVCDAVFDHLKKLRWMPTLRVVHPYYKEEAYIDALKTSIENHYKTLDWKPDLLLTSYHGIPQRYFKAGDPYSCHCYGTTNRLRDALGLTDEQIKTTFQSRFGKEPWLQPYTDETLESLPAKGIKNIAVITPGFAADCVETLEEMALEGKETFLEAGGKNFTFIPCLNDSSEHIQLLKTLSKNNLQGL